MLTDATDHCVNEWRYTAEHLCVFICMYSVYVPVRVREREKLTSTQKKYITFPSHSQIHTCKILPIHVSTQQM